jgi:hypothetical protein
MAIPISYSELHGSQPTDSPLSLLTIENIENVFAYIDEIKLTDVLDGYSRQEHNPLSTFNGIFDQNLRARGLDDKRRYKWSVTRCEEFLDSIMGTFHS